jgi:hypothetical protein
MNQQTEPSKGFAHNGEEKTETRTCCLCGKQFIEYGNDPWPLADREKDGKCCNASKVMPARLRMGKAQ